MKYSYKDFEIIDAHTHIFPAKIAHKASSHIGEFYDLPARHFGESLELLENGARFNVSRFLVCSAATVSGQVQFINDFIAGQCREHDKFFGFGTLHPDMEDLEAEVERIISLGLHGIKIHPDFQRFDIDCPGAYRIYDAISGKLPILIHMGDDRYEFSRPEKLAHVLDDFHGLQVIAAHFGGYRCWDEALSCLRRPNVKVDTSSTTPWVGSERTKALIDSFGVENCFFGTDFPLWDYATEVERFFELELGFEDCRKILSENFKAYFSL